MPPKGKKTRTVASSSTTGSIPLQYDGFRRLEEFEMEHSRQVAALKARKELIEKEIKMLEEKAKTSKPTSPSDTAKTVVDGVHQNYTDETESLQIQHDKIVAFMNEVSSDDQLKLSEDKVNSILKNIEALHAAIMKDFAPGGIVERLETKLLRNQLAKRDALIGDLWKAGSSLQRLIGQQVDVLGVKLPARVVLAKDPVKAIKETVDQMCKVLTQQTKEIERQSNTISEQSSHMMQVEKEKNDLQHEVDTLTVKLSLAADVDKAVESARNSILVQTLNDQRTERKAERARLEDYAMSWKDLYNAKCEEEKELNVELRKTRQEMAEKGAELVRFESSKFRKELDRLSAFHETSTQKTMDVYYEDLKNQKSDMERKRQEEILDLKAFHEKELERSISKLQDGMDKSSREYKEKSMELQLNMDASKKEADQLRITTSLLLAERVHAAKTRQKLEGDLRHTKEKKAELEKVLEEKERSMRASHFRLDDLQRKNLELSNNSAHDKQELHSLIENYEEALTDWKKVAKDEMEFREESEKDAVKLEGQIKALQSDHNSLKETSRNQVEEITEQTQKIHMCDQTIERQTQKIDEQAKKIEEQASDIKEHKAAFEAHLKQDRAMHEKNDTFVKKMREDLMAARAEIMDLTKALKKALELPDEPSESENTSEVSENGDNGVEEEREA